MKRSCNAKKGYLRKGMSAFLVMAMLVTTVSDPLSSFAQAKITAKEQEKQEELALKKSLAETKDEYPDGAIGFLSTQVSVAEGKKTELTIVRQGGTDKEASVCFKAVDVSADYGKDYQIAVKEGKDTTILEAPKNHESLLSKYSDSVRVENSKKESESEKDKFSTGSAVSEIADTKGTVALDELSSLEKAAALQNGYAKDQKSWREIEESDAESDAYTQAEQITGKGEDALKKVLENVEGVSYTFTFEKGEYKKVVEIETIDDDLAETDEQIMIMLTNVKGSKLSASNTGYVNIKDNEESEVNVFKMQDSSQSVERGTDEVNVVVTRTSGIEQMAVMGVGTIEDTAKPGTDYTALTETLVFVPGEKEKTVTIPLLPNMDADGDVSFYVGATTNNDNVVDATASMTKVTITSPKKVKKSDRTFGEVSVKDDAATISVWKEVCYSKGSTQSWTKSNLDLRNAEKIEVSFSSTKGGRKWKDGCKEKEDYRRKVKLTLISGNKSNTFYEKEEKSIDDTVTLADLPEKGMQSGSAKLKAEVTATHDNNAADLYIKKIKIYYRTYSVEVVNDYLNSEGEVYNAGNCYKEKQYTAAEKSTEVGKYIQIGTMKINNNTSTSISRYRNSVNVSYSLNTSKDGYNSAGVGPSTKTVTFKTIEIRDKNTGKWVDTKKTTLSAKDLLSTYAKYATNDNKLRIRPVFEVKKAKVQFKNNTQATVETSNGQVRKNKSQFGSFNGFKNGTTYTNMTMLDTFVVSAAPKAGYSVSSISVSGGSIFDNTRKDVVKFGPNNATTTVDINYTEAYIDVKKLPNDIGGDKGEVIYYDADTGETISTATGGKGEMKIPSIIADGSVSYNIIGLAKPGYRAEWTDGTIDTDGDGIFEQDEKDAYPNYKSFAGISGTVLEYKPQEPYTKIYYDFVQPRIQTDSSKQVSLVGRVYLVDEELFSGKDISEEINGATVSVGESSSDEKDSDSYTDLTKTLTKRNKYASKGDGYFEIPGNGSFYTGDSHLVNVNYTTEDGSNLNASVVMHPADYTEIDLDTQSVMQVDKNSSALSYWNENDGVWSELPYKQMDNGDYKCRMDFSVTSQKVSVQPMKAELKFYSEDGKYLTSLTEEVDAENIGQFSFEFNPKKLELPSGATAALKVYDQNNKGYYERKTGIVVKESIGIIDLVNSFEFGGLNTAIKLVGKIDSALDLGWNGSLSATNPSDNVYFGEDGSITLSFGFATDGLVDKSATNVDTLESLAQEKAEADQALIDAKKKADKDKDKDSEETKKKLQELEQKVKDADQAYNKKKEDESLPQGKKKSAEVAGNVKLDLGVRLSLTFAYDEKNNANYFDKMVLAVDVSGGAGISVSYMTPIGITIGLAFSIEGSGTATFTISRQTDQLENKKYYLTTVKNENAVKDNAGKINLFNLGNDEDDAFNMKGTLNLEPTITIEASAGVGGMVEVSVSGSAAFKMNFFTDDEENNGTVNLSASIGIKVLFVSAKWPFVSKDVNLFGNSTASDSLADQNYLHDSASMLKASDREYLENRGKWNSGEMSLKSLDQNDQGVAEKELLQGIYSGTDVELTAINDSGDYLGVFVDDTGKRDALNGAAAYYTIYDHNKGTWSEPAIIEDDGMIDQDVSVFDLGNRGIMVTWSSANRVFDDSDSRTSMMNSMDIHGVFFNKETKTFGDIMQITKETNNNVGTDNVGDTEPSVVYNDDSMIVYYTKSEYAVSDSQEGEVIGDVVYPDYTAMAYRKYNFSGEEGTAGAWVVDYADLGDGGKTKQDLVASWESDEVYQQYVEAWYGQMFFDTMPAAFVEEELDEQGYWKEGTEAVTYPGYTVSNDITTSDGENGGVVSGSAVVTGTSMEQVESPKIIDSDAISYNDLGLFAFTADYDQSMKTTGDRDVYVQMYDFETCTMSHPILLSSSNVEDSNVHFVKTQYTTKNEETGKDYVYEATYLTWLSEGNIVALNVSNVIKNCLSKKSTSNGVEYYIVDKSADGKYEPLMTLVEGEVPEDNEGAISPISSYDVAANDGYVYLTWTQSDQTLKEGVEEDSEEATDPANQNIETQVYMARYDFAEGGMTEPVQVTSGAGDNYDNISFVVNKDGTVTAMAAKAGTKVVDAEEFNEVIDDYNAAASEDEKQDSVTKKDFTEYAAVDSENKSLVAMQITPTSVLKLDQWNVDPFVAGDNNSFSIDLLNDGIDTLEGAVVTMTDQSGKSILQNVKVTSEEDVSESSFEAADSITIDKMMGGNRYTVNGLLALDDDADKGIINVKVTDKNGDVLVEEKYEQEIKEEVAVSDLKVTPTEERDVYDVTFDVTNNIYKNAKASEAVVGIKTADGKTELVKVPVEALEKGETKTVSTSVTVDSSKQFVEGKDAEGAMTETGTFYVKLAGCTETADVVRTASDAEIEMMDAITEGKIADGGNISVGVGQTFTQEVNITSSLADEETGATGAENLQVLWKTEDEDVAIVDKSGNLTGVNEGTTKLTAVVLPNSNKTVVTMSEDSGNETYHFGVQESGYASVPNKLIKTYTTTVNVTKEAVEDKKEDPSPTPTTEPTAAPSAEPSVQPSADPVVPTETPKDTQKSETKTAVKKGISYRYTASGSAVTITKAKAGLKKLTIPATVKINGKNYKVTKIADGAFKKCKKLQSVVIGKNVTAIGKKAFYGCSKLKKVTFKGKKVPKIGTKAFGKINKKAVFKVPAKSYKKYKKKLTKKTGVTGKMKIKK